DLISSQGNIAGRSVDASGIAHGIMAPARARPPTTPAGQEMKANFSRSLSLHSTRRPRRGEAQCRRAELSIGGPAPSPLCDDAGPGCLAGVLRSSSARSRSINGTERSERRRAAIRALQQAVERFADATATKRFPSSRCGSAISLFARWNPSLSYSFNSSQLCCTVIRAVYDDAGNAIETHEHT